MGKRILGPRVFAVLSSVIGAVALLGASLMNAGPVHAQRVGSAVVTPGPTQTTPDITTYPPQPGFDPLTASAAALRANGYPPRPSGGPALAAWQTAISRATHYVPPVLIPSSHSFGPAVSSRASWSGSYEYSYNYAGHVMPQAALGNPNLYYSWAEWTVPAVPGDPNYSNEYPDKAPDAAFWAGTGVQQIIQAGTSSISTSTPQYLFWVDDAPNNADYAVGPNGQTLLTTPGDTVAVSTDYSGSLNGGGTATFWLEDLTSSNYTMFTMNNVEYPGWRAADFINERPIINDHFLYLPDFGSSVFTDCFTEDDSGDIWYLVTSNNNRWYMTTNGLSSGTIMSETGAVDNYTNGFTVDWESAGP